MKGKVDVTDTCLFQTPTSVLISEVSCCKAYCSEVQYLNILTLIDGGTSNLLLEHNIWLSLQEVCASCYWWCCL